jgi:hypothetical protein
LRWLRFDSILEFQQSPPPSSTRHTKLGHTSENGEIVGTFIDTFTSRLPYIGRLKREISALKAELRRWRTWQPPGHFYSPIPSLEEIQADAKRIFQNPVPPLSGVNLNVARQLELLSTIGRYHADLPEQWKRSGLARYHYENEYYSWADAIVLYCMLRHLHPRRLVEVGSGFSSGVILDTDEIFLSSSIACTFIDPHPERLLGLINDKDRIRTRILAQRVQDVGLDVFRALEAGDILLVDSSHVSKTGSDLNRMMFDVLPALARGVYVHFHDVFYPFEYPESWVREGVSWNEAYLLHAFLQYNEAFNIELFTSYLLQCHRDMFAALLPLAMNSEGTPLLITGAPGASLWICRCH